MSEIRIAVLVPLPSAGSGGVIKHLRQVIPRFAASRRVHSVTVFAFEGVLPQLERFGVRIERIAADSGGRGFKRMGRVVDSGGFDVALSVTARPVHVTCVPLVTMLQNVEPLQRHGYRMPLAWRMRLWVLKWEYRRACREATRVIAVSRYVRELLDHSFGLPGKTDIVYHGFNPDDLRQASRPPEVPDDEPYVFSAGSLLPYRGYEDLIRALGYLRRRGRRISRLVLAGADELGRGRRYHRWLKELCRSELVEDRVIWAGHLTAAQMSWCYRHSELFVQTSRAESFSNVQIEAMACGCRIVSCTQPPMPEILSDAAVYYETGDIVSLSQKIEGVCSMAVQESEALRAKAKLRAGHFSWDKTAEQTLDVLERAIAEHEQDRTIGRL